MIPRPKRTTKYARWKAKDKRQFAEYVDWLSRQGCVICGHRPVDIAHGPASAFGRKGSFADALPICPEHHRLSKHSQHVLGRFFWEHWQLNRDQLVNSYRTQFEQQKACLHA